MLGAIATVQIVLTVALLAGAALLVRTARNLANIRPGYDIQNILAMTVTTVTPNSFLPFHTAVLERVAALPGVARGIRLGPAAHGQQMAGNNGDRGTGHFREASRPIEPSASVGHTRLL